MSRGLGLLALVLATVCWGATVVSIRFASDELGVASLTVLDGGSAAVALLIVMAIRRRPLPRLDRRLLAISFLEPGVAYVLINYGIAHTSGSHASLIVGTESLFVIALVTVMTRRRPALSILLGLTLATGGTALLANSGTGHATVSGDLFVLVGIAASAGYVVLMQPLTETADPIDLTAGQFVYGAFVTLPLTALCAATGALPSFDWAPPRFIIAAIGVGVIGSMVAFALYNWAMSHVAQAVSAISLTLIPVFGLSFSIVLLGDELSARTLVAAALVITGVLITARAESGPAAVAA